MTTHKESPQNSLRDARLAKALQHMPDSHMRVSSQARLVVLRAAQEAVGKNAEPVRTSANQQAQTKRWWHALLGAPQNRMPWNAAFATVLIASFVTLLWQGKEVPDAKPDSDKISEASADRPTAAPVAITTAAATAEPAIPPETPSSSKAPAPLPASAANSAAPPQSFPATSPSETSDQNAAKAPSEELNAQSKVKRDEVALVEKKQTEKKTSDTSDSPRQLTEKSTTQSNKPDAAASAPPLPAIAEAASVASVIPPTATTLVTPAPARAAAPMAVPRAAAAPAVTQATRRAEVASAASEEEENADTRKKIGADASAHKESAGSSAKPLNRGAIIPTVRLQFEGQERLVKIEKAQALLQSLRTLAQAASDKTEEKAEGLVSAPLGTDFMLNLNAGKEVWTYDAKTARLSLRRYIGESVGFQNQSVQINAAQYSQLRGLLQAIQSE